MIFRCLRRKGSNLDSIWYYKLIEEVSALKVISRLAIFPSSLRFFSKFMVIIVFPTPVIPVINIGFSICIDFPRNH